MGVKAKRLKEAANTTTTKKKESAIGVKTETAEGDRPNLETSSGKIPDRRRERLLQKKERRTKSREGETTSPR